MALGCVRSCQPDVERPITYDTHLDLTDFHRQIWREFSFKNIIIIAINIVGKLYYVQDT